VICALAEGVALPKIILASVYILLKNIIISKIVCFSAFTDIVFYDKYILQI